LTEPNLAELWSDCKDEIDEAETPTEMKEACEPVLMGIAELLARDEDMLAKSWADQLKAKTGFNKSEIMKTAKSLVSEVEVEVDEADGAPFDAVLENNLNRVVIYRSTDAHTDTGYHWYLGDDTKFVTQNGEHWSFQPMREAYHGATGDLPGKPVRTENEEWRQFIADLMKEAGEVRESVGPRTEATEKLGNYISQRDGYPELHRAINKSAIWTPGAEFDTDGAQLSTPDFAGVPNDAIKTICEAEAITPRALQAELDARELLHTHASPEYPGEPGLPDTVRVWKVSTDLAEPKNVEPPIGDDESEDGDTEVSE
jgi:hypothetical protein